MKARRFPRTPIGPTFTVTDAQAYYVTREYSPFGTTEVTLTLVATGPRTGVWPRPGARVVLQPVTQ